MNITEALLALDRLNLELTAVKEAAANIALEIRLLRQTLNRLEVEQCEGVTPTTTNAAPGSTTG